jgi:hypothetical protein
MNESDYIHLVIRPGGKDRRTQSIFFRPGGPTPVRTVLMMIKQKMKDDSAGEYIAYEKSGVFVSADRSSEDFLGASLLIFASNRDEDRRAYFGQTALN